MEHAVLFRAGRGRHGGGGGSPPPLGPPRPSSGAGSGPRCCVTLLLPATGRHSPAPAPAAGIVARTSWGQRARPARAPSLSALHCRPHPGKWGAQPLGSRLSRGPPLLSPRVGTSRDPRTRGGGRGRGDERGGTKPASCRGAVHSRGAGSTPPRRGPRPHAAVSVSGSSSGGEPQTPAALRATLCRASRWF